MVSCKGRSAHIWCMSSSASGGTGRDQTRTDHSVSDQRIASDSALCVSKIFQYFACVMQRGCAGDSTELIMSRCKTQNDSPFLFVDASANRT